LILAQYKFYKFNLIYQIFFWKSRNVTLFGKVLIIKSVGLSQLVYSASNVNVPEEYITATKKVLFGFLWSNKRDKIRRNCSYQDYKMGGIRMPDVDLMNISLRNTVVLTFLKCNKG